MLKTALVDDGKDGVLATGCFSQPAAITTKNTAKKRIHTECGNSNRLASRLKKVEPH
jgi:hypothetical protein